MERLGGLLRVVARAPGAADLAGKLFTALELLVSDASKLMEQQEGKPEDILARALLKDSLHHSSPR
jgi:hypothetical protein